MSEQFWISVKDREPPIGDMVFAVMYEGRAYNVMARGGGNWKHVSHWAPIPPVPEDPQPDAPHDPPDTEYREAT